MLDCFLRRRQNGRDEISRPRLSAYYNTVYSVPLRRYVWVLKRKAVDGIEKAASRISGCRSSSRLPVIEIVAAAAAAVEITVKQQYYKRYAQPRSKGQLVVLVHHGVQQKQIQ